MLLLLSDQGSAVCTATRYVLDDLVIESSDILWTPQTNPEAQPLHRMRTAYFPYAQVAGGMRFIISTLLVPWLNKLNITAPVVPPSVTTWLFLGGHFILNTRA
jgi:hypothetical protein